MKWHKNNKKCNKKKVIFRNIITTIQTKKLYLQNLLQFAKSSLFEKHQQTRDLKLSQTEGSPASCSAPCRDSFLQNDSTGSSIRSWIIQDGCVTDTIYVCLTELVVYPVSVRLCQLLGSYYPFTSPLWRPHPLSQDAQGCETSSQAKKDRNLSWIPVFTNGGRYFSEREIRRLLCVHKEQRAKA